MGLILKTAFPLVRSRQRNSHTSCPFRRFAFMRLPFCMLLLFAPACAFCHSGDNCVSPGVSIVWTMLVLTEASMVTAFQRQQSAARLFYLRLHLCPHLGHRQAMAPPTAALAGRSRFKLASRWDLTW